MTSRACGGAIACAASAVGTASTAPDFRRFMLLLMKACGLVRNNATSIWSSETPVAVSSSRCARANLRDERGTRRRRSRPTAHSGCSASCGGLGARDSAGAAAGEGAAATRRSARGAATGGGDIGAAGGASATAGAVERAAAAGTAGLGAGARAIVGGSNSSVYSRTRRPVAQEISRMTSTNGSCTPRSLVNRTNWRPSGRRCSVARVPGSTALYSTLAER